MDNESASESPNQKQPLIPKQSTSRKPFYNYGGLNRIPFNTSSTGDTQLATFKNLATKLGFGINEQKSSSEKSRMLLGLIDVIPDEEQAGPVGSGTAPLTRSSYIRRLSMLGTRSLRRSPVKVGEVTSRSSVDEQWKMNYKEAAIFLEEGQNNEEFKTHPKRAESLPAYLLAHTPWFHVLDLLVSFLILCLPIIEKPTLPSIHVPLYVQVSIELAFLIVIAFGVGIKARWLGIRPSLRHIRTLLKLLILILMLTETIVILVRGVSHFRISRALRPVFILDNRHLRGVRRFARGVLQCLPPILDMLVLLIFLVFIFSLLGHYLFGKNPKDPFFSTLEDSFINLFILLTTANYPDIMMEAYYMNPLNVVFFAVYIIVTLFFFTNLLLAVVYDNFTAIEQEKLRKLVLHKRKACLKAYHLLVSKANNHGIIFRHFCGMVMVYQPWKSLRDIYLMFRAMDHSLDGYLSKEEFCHFFEYSNLTWTPLPTIPEKPWPILKDFGLVILRFLNSKYSEFIFISLIILNTLCTCVRWMKDDHGYLWDAYLFGIFFGVEMTMKILIWGTKRILCSGWQTFDLIATIAFIIVIILPHHYGGLLYFIRPLRLLRVFKFKKRYRNVLGTLFILLRPMASASIILILLYYFFAIIGMEIFLGINLKNCCNGTLIESYYIFPSNDSFGLRFYMNTFTNIFTSYVTLFELMVVNNWYVIMEGHVRVTSRWTRIYFFLFYLSTIILLNIVVAFILDTFIFRMRYKRRIDKIEEDKLLRTEVKLNLDEIHFCYHEIFQDHSKEQKFMNTYKFDIEHNGSILFVGKEKRTKEILFKRVCKNEISDLINKNDDT